MLFALNLLFYTENLFVQNPADLPYHWRNCAAWCFGSNVSNNSAAGSVTYFTFQKAFIQKKKWLLEVCQNIVEIMCTQRCLYSCISN